MFLGALLFVRALIYWQIGPALRWSGILNLGVISLSFRSDWLRLVLMFSILSFLLALGVLYSCLLLLSLLKGPKPIQDFVRLQLGRIDDWHPGVKAVLPFVVTAIGWWALSWALVSLRVIPQPISPAARVEQSLIIAVQSYLIWKFPIAVLLALHLLNNYIYFGRHPIWNYADVTANTQLRPLKNLRWLRIGKVDLRPIIGIAMVIFIAEFASHALPPLYAYLQSSSSSIGRASSPAAVTADRKPSSPPPSPSAVLR